MHFFCGVFFLFLFGLHPNPPKGIAGIALRGGNNRDLFGGLRARARMKYNERSLLVLALLGTLSAVMSVLSVLLLFQLRSQQAAVQEFPSSTSSTSAVLGAPVWAVLLPVSAALAALSLTLHLSSAVVCLLHSYFSTEVCRGEQDTDRYLSRSFAQLLKKESSSAVSSPPVRGALKQLLDSLLVLQLSLDSGLGDSGKDNSQVGL